MMKKSLQSIYFKRVLVFCLIILLVTTSLLMVAPGAIQPDQGKVWDFPTVVAPAGPTEAELESVAVIWHEAHSRGVHAGRAGNDNINVTPVGSFSPAYLGDQDKDFYIWVTESYEEEYLDYVVPFATPEGDHNGSLWNVTLDEMAFYYDDQPMSPVVWDAQSEGVDNNNGFGWLINGGLGFYNDSATNRMFRFNINPYSVQTGVYELRLTFSYRLLINYSNALGEYNFTTTGVEKVIEEEILAFEIMSCMDSNYKVEPVDETNQVINSGRFYAGAHNQKMQIVFNKLYPGAALENVNVTLIPPEFVQMYRTIGIAEQYTVTLNSLTSQSPFYWRVNINATTPPGVYYGSPGEGYVYYEYTRSDNQVRVIEAARYPVDFIIDYTPLVQPPATDGMTAAVPPEHTIHQGTSKTMLPVSFENSGNVDLYDVELGLDVTNSHIQPPYYYNAGASDTKTELIISYDTISYLPVGGSAYASFNLSLFKRLPKGKYFVPVVYEAWYFNNGSLGDPSGFVKTTQNDFINVRSTHDVTLLDTMAHMALQILDDEPALTVNPTTIATYSAGVRNQVISLTVANYELYGFQNVTVSIRTTAESPFEYRSEHLGIDYLANKTFSTIHAGTANMPYSTTFSILTDIKPAANGYYSVPVLLSGWDEFNDYFEFGTSFEISIIPQLPEFIVVNSVNSEILPGENFTLSVTLKNVGASPANNLSILFIGSSDYTNTFNPSGDGIVTIDSLDAGEQVIVRFNATSDANLSTDNDYQVALKFKYTDVLGNVYGFNDNPPAIFIIRTSHRVLPEAVDTFLITSISPQDIVPGETVTLTVNLMNVGDFEVTTASLKLISTSNLFMIETDPKQGLTVGPLPPNTERSAKFTVMVGDGVETGEDYEFQLFIEYKDAMNQTKAYDTSDCLVVTVHVKEPPAAEEKDEVNWGLVGGSIAALIILFIIIFLVNRKFMGRSGKPPAAEPQPEEAAKEGKITDEVKEAKADETKADEKPEKPKEEPIKKPEAKPEDRPRPAAAKPAPSSAPSSPAATSTPPPAEATKTVVKPVKEAKPASVPPVASGEPPAKDETTKE
ncbi:COG1361 S-layer family protein [[Eubacterium] cellulosolvens]